MDAESADMEQAKQLMSEVANSKKNITLYVNDSLAIEAAVAVQAQWKGSGSRARSSSRSSRSTWSSSGRRRTATSTSTGSAGSATSSTRSTSSTSGRASRATTTNWCNKDYDAKIEEARTTTDNDARYALYGEAEEIMFGQDGEMPLIPIYFYTFVNLEKEPVADKPCEPAEPDRPDQGRRHRVTHVGPTEGRARALPSVRKASTRVGKADAEVHRQADLLDDPRAPGRHLPDLHDDAPDRGKPVPEDGARRARVGPAEPRAQVPPRPAWYVQYGYYVKGVFTFDLGPSLVIRGRDVNDIVKTHLPKSIELGLYAFCFAIIVGVPLGMLAALKHNTAVDYGAMFFSNVFHACRALVATLLIYFVSLELGALPTSGWTTWRAGPADDRARLRADGAVRAPRARNHAGDPAAGLRAHGAGEGPPLPPRRRPARAPELAHPVITAAGPLLGFIITACS